MLCCGCHDNQDDPVNSHCIWLNIIPAMNIDSPSLPDKAPIKKKLPGENRPARQDGSGKRNYNLLELCMLET